MNNISANIIGSDFGVEEMLDSLKKAVSLSNDIEKRYQNAINSNYPTIENIFSSKHEQWINEIINISTSNK